MNNRKILLVKLDKGRLKDNGYLLGSLLLEDKDGSLRHLSVWMVIEKSE